MAEKRYFGTDGVRGRFGKAPMDVETLLSLGRAIGSWLVENETGDSPWVLMGQDTRQSGDVVGSAVMTGLMEAGVDVMPIGVIPTPAVAILARKWGASGGVVISASHNPHFDNGVKLFKGDGFKLTDAEECDIESRMGRGPEGGAPGRKRIPESDAVTAYVEFLRKNGADLSGLKVVLDCSHGATWTAAPRVFDALGATCETLFNAPDGVNINVACGSQHPEALGLRVRETGADLGLAFDGDGDRLIAVDAEGEPVSGDQLIAIFAREGIKGQPVPQVVVTTVMSNLGLRKMLAEVGITHRASAVGDRNVLSEMKRTGARIGGEDSGHLIFLDPHCTGDGLFAAIRLCDILKKTKESLASLSRLMETFPQLLVNVRVASKPDVMGVPEIAHVIREAERRLEGEGRVLVRYSGTEPLCRVMVEAASAESAKIEAERIAGVIREKIGA